MIEPAQDCTLSNKDLQKRWQCNRGTVNRRLRLGGVPVIRFSDGATRVRLSDILAYEQARTCRWEDPVPA